MHRYMEVSIKLSKWETMSTKSQRLSDLGWSKWSGLYEAERKMDSEEEESQSHTNQQNQNRMYDLLSCCSNLLKAVSIIKNVIGRVLSGTNFSFTLSCNQVAWFNWNQTLMLNVYRFTFLNENSRMILWLCQAGYYVSYLLVHFADGKE